MQQKITENFVKKQLESLRESLTGVEMLIMTDVINQDILDRIDGPAVEVAWELFQTICDIEPEGCEFHKRQFEKFTDFICGRTEYKDVDEFIKYFKELK